MANFGEIIKQIRLSKGMSQEEFGELIGTSKQVISRYENSQRIPKISVAKKIADILGLPISALVDNGSSNDLPCTQQDELTKELLVLFSLLSEENKRMVLKMIKGILEND